MSCLQGIGLKTAVVKDRVIKIIVSIFIVSSLTVLLFPVRIYLDELVIEAKLEAVSRLEDKIGHEISYSSIAPSIFHIFEIRDFSILSADQNTADPLLSVEKIRLNFNLFKFRADNPLNAFQGLIIVNSAISYDSSRNEELMEVLQSLSSSSDEPRTSTGFNEFSEVTSGLPQDFSIKGRNINISVKTGKINARMSRMFFTIKRSLENEMIITLKADTGADLSDISDLFPQNNLEFKTSFDLSGRFDQQFEWADFNLKTKDLDFDFFSIDKIAWNFKYDNSGLISVTKTGDNIPVDLDFSYDFNLQKVDIGLIAQDFIFSRYIGASDYLSAYSDFLNSEISGEASLQYDISSKDINYAGALSVRRLKLKNIEFLAGSPLSIDITADGNNNIINISESYISSAPGSAGFSGSIILQEELPLINGYLSIPGFIYNDINLKTALYIDSGIDSGYNLSASETLLNGLKLSNTGINLTPYDENIEFHLDTDVITSDEKPDHVFSEGIIQLGEDYYIQAAADVENLLIAPIVSAIPGDASLPAFLENFDITTELFISGTLRQLSFASPDIYLADRLNDDRNLAFSLSGNNSGVRITGLNLNWDQNRIAGKLSADLTEDKNIVLQSDIDYNGSMVKAGGVYSPDGNLSFTGDYGLKFNLFSVGDLHSFKIKTERLPLKSAENETYLSLNAAGYFSAIDNWKILLNSITLEDIPTGYGSGRVSMSAFLDQSGGSIYSLDYIDGQTELSGGGSVQLFDLLPGIQGLAHLNLYSAESNERYSAVFSYQNEQLDGNIDFTAFPLKRVIAESPIDGSINGSLSAAGRLNSPELRLSLDSKNAVFNGERLDFSASAAYADLNIHIEHINASYGSYNISDLAGSLNFESGQHRLDGKILSESSLMPLSSDISIEADTEPVGSIFDVTTIIESDLSSVILVDDLVFNEEKKDPWRFKLQKREKLININGGTENEINFNFFDDGYFTVEIESPFPVRLNASGTVSEGNINASINDISYVIDELRIPYFIFYEGSLTGKLRIQGPLNDPNFYGQLDFHDMVFKPPIVKDITEPFDTSFFLSGREIELPATRVKTTNGLIYINLIAQMERWLPRNYDININVPEGQSVEAEFYRSPFYVNGFAEGIIHIYGDFNRMVVDGDIKASEGIFMFNDSLDLPSMGKPTRYMSNTFNIEIKEDNRFIWPRIELPIVEGFLSSGSKLKMLYATETGLVLDGNLDLNGGEIFYFERNFYIKSGGITFNNDTVQNMDPLLNARAEIRDINTEGEMTKIYLIVDESPLSSFTPRFESEPSMSTAEILSMIGGNIFDSIDTEDTNIAITDAVLLGTDLLTQFAIMRNIEDGIKSTLGLDLLSIRSSFLSNLLEDTVFSSSDSSDSSNFAQYLDNTTLFLGKYFTDDIFLQGMFQFDLYNDTGYSDDLNMNVDSEIKLEWEGPVANVELNFYPDFEDPIEGLHSTSLGLSWRFSY